MNNKNTFLCTADYNKNMNENVFFLINSLSSFMSIKYYQSTKTTF